MLHAACSMQRYKNSAWFILARKEKMAGSRLILIAAVTLLQPAMFSVEGHRLNIQDFGRRFKPASVPEVTEPSLEGISFFRVSVKDEKKAGDKHSSKIVRKEEPPLTVTMVRSAGVWSSRFPKVTKGGVASRSAIQSGRIHSSLKTFLEDTAVTSEKWTKVKSHHTERKLQNDDSARAACEADAAVFEGQPEGFSCACELDAGVGYRLECESSCGEFCNAEVTVCGVKTLSRIYNSEGLNTIKMEGFDYRRGYLGEVEIRRLGCTDDENCSECIGVVGGDQACNSCSIQICSDGTQEPFLNCQNIRDGAIFDFCKSDFNVQAGDFEFLSTGEFEDCVQPLEVPLSVCENDRLFYDNVPDKDYICECSQRNFDTVILSCRTGCGDFCNDDESVCGTEVYEQLYDLSGNPYLLADNFFYSIGISERLVVVKSDCSRAEGAAVDDIFCYGCSVRVGQFSRCDDCFLQTCADGRQAPLANCQDIGPGGDFFDLCDPSMIQVDRGIFEYWSGNEFNTCVDRSPENDICNGDSLPLLADGSSIIGATELAVDDGAPKCSVGSFGPGLWYNVVGNGLGIEASTCGEGTDFDTALTIYSGLCGELECVATNDDTALTGDCEFGHSSVSWFAEEGITYRIRVHGFGTTRGQFQLTLSEVDLAEKACLSEVRRLERLAPSISGATCRCEAHTNSSQILTCEDTCEYCNDEETLCGTQTFGGTFLDNETRFSKFKEHQYTQGRTEVLRVTEVGCSGSNGCESCSATVNGQECENCMYTDCINQFGIVTGSGLQVECGNIQAGASYNECEENVAELTLFEALSREEFRECVQEPIDACQAVAAKRQEEFSDLGTECSCEVVADRAILTCKELGCQYCNRETSICANTTYGAEFVDNSGKIASTFVEQEYVEGRDEVLRYQVTDDTCIFTIDGTECNNCTVVSCGSSFASFDGIDVDCSNIMEDAVFNECNQPSSIVEDGRIFQVFSLEFDYCLGGENPEQACQEAKEAEEGTGAQLDYGTTCECTSNAITGDHTLSCTDLDCIFCNYDGTVCATNAFGLRYGRFGQEMGDFQTYTYVEAEGGRTESVVLETFNQQCTLAVDEQECSSCEVVSCGNAIFPLDRFEVNCENVPDGGSFGSGCDRAFVDSGVLEVATDFEFHICIKSRLPVDVCEEEMNERQANGNSCECSHNEYGGKTLTCVNQRCLKCNHDGTVCGYEIRGTKYGNKGQELGGFQGFKYIEGREDTIVFGMVRDPADERECYVSANGIDCDFCSINNCFGPGVEVQCENVEEGANFNECTLDPVEEGVFEYFSALEFDECITPQDPLDFCEDHKNFYETSQTHLGTICDCVRDGEGVKLSCLDTKCKFCSPDENLCKVDIEYGAMIGKHGFFLSSFETIAFIDGRNERVVTKEGPGNFCEVSVNGEVCSSCSIALCPGGSSGIDIDCGNLIPGAVHSGCDGSGHEVFQHVSDDNFNICIAYDGTFSPTAFPTAAPVPPTTSPTEVPTEASSAGFSTSTSIVVLGAPLMLLVVFSTSMF